MSNNNSKHMVVRRDKHEFNPCKPAVLKNRGVLPYLSHGYYDVGALASEWLLLVVL
jgi:hypothetical protein